MVKCPNCGSTAQPQVRYIASHNRQAITEIITCGCGCEITAFYTLKREVTRTKDGTQIGHRKGDE